ncbi:MAG: amidohydrolase [Endozoicomonas sp.]
MKLLRHFAGFTVFAALLIAVAAFSTWYYLNPQPPAQQLFVNGSILTMDDNNSIVEAVLVEDDRIVATGTRQALRQQADESVELIDLKGRTLVPGFIEAHGHFPASGLDAVAVDLNSPPIGNILSIAEVKERLSKKAEELPEGQWLVGYGFDDTMVVDRRFLTRQDLDEVSTRHPIYIMHISGHMGITNSAGLAVSGIDASTPDPEGGEIVRSEDGQPTGLLKETAHEPVRAAAMKLSVADSLTLLGDSVRDYLIQGVTTVQSGLMSRPEYQPLGLMTDFGVIPQRLVIWPDEELAEALDAEETGPINSDKVTTGALKAITDGSIQGYTGYLGTPYFQQEPEKEQSYRGYPTLSRENLQALVSKWHGKGWQLALHANGDAAIDQVLDAIETAQDENPRPDARHIIVHAQTARSDQLERMYELSVTPTFFSSHIYYWGDRHQSIFLGADRASRISPLRTTGDHDVRYTIHTDTPVVPIDPLGMVSHAVHRKTSSGKVLGPEERIDVMQALRATTIDAAWQVFEEDTRGSIEPGKFADFAVLSGNPLEEGDRFAELEVIQTWIGGVKRYDQDEFGTFD